MHLCTIFRCYHEHLYSKWLIGEFYQQRKNKSSVSEVTDSSGFEAVTVVDSTKLSSFSAFGRRIDN